MPTSQEILAIAQGGIEKTAAARRGANGIALQEMNRLANRLAGCDLFIPRDPFVFAMFGQSIQMDGPSSKGQSLVSSAAANFVHRKKHTVFANGFPADQLHIFDEKSANEYKADPSLRDSESQSAARYRITEDAGTYWGRVVVPTFAVTNFRSVMHNYSPEVESSEYVTLILSRRSPSNRCDIEHVEPPKYQDDLDHRMRMSGHYVAEDVVDAFRRSRVALQNHPDYKLSS